MIRLSKKLPLKAAHLFIFLCSIISMSAQSQSDLKLWYKAPSLNQWESALPIGNGRLGAMIYGNVATETIQLNEHTVWSGGPNRNDNPLALEALPELRKLIFDGKYKEADKMANQVIITKKSHGQMFQPVANLQIDFPGHAEFSNYHRELDLRTAIATTTYVANGVTYTREALASFTERVIAIKLKASQKGKLSFTTSYTSPHLNKKTTINGQNELVIDGKTSDHEGVPSVVNFEGISHITIKGGSLQRNDTSITVKDATEATIYISIATNFNSYNDVSGNEKLRAKQALEQASKISFDKLKKKHIKAYQSFFNRVDLDLGVAKDLTSPTDERLKKFNDNNDPQFVELYFQFGRYLLISSSQSGGQPANLQGIWNNRLNAPWDSKYTININAEMNYWPAERTNLSELHQPFLQMVKELAITGQETAKTMYGARGWVAHHNTDIWRATGAIDGARWGVWPTGGAWLSQHLWEHYLYTGDKKFLEEIYPTIKGAATFFVDFLIEHPKFKWLVVTPSTSPENAPKEYDDIAVNAGVTMDNQLVFEIFSTTIRAAEILGVDQQFMDTLKMKRALLPPMQIGQHNQLQEWLEDLDDPNDKHRHISHLYGLFPANQIS
nr:glycoside hydrolase N-terminal domain-containing protein [Saprospiraceae bacterium]